MDSVSEGGVLLPIHKHPMVPWNDMRRGDCCGRYESITDGYFCQICDFFVHKICGDETSDYIQHPSHSLHNLQLLPSVASQNCNLCRRDVVDQCYRCEICNFDVCLCCAKYPTEVNTEMHHHKLTLVKRRREFNCDARCGKPCDDGISYKCHECDLFFHVDCVWNLSEVIRPEEVNHSYHPCHPLKLITGHPQDYSDGQCRLCGRKVDKWFYHCSSCNFTLDLRCVLTPPPQSLVDLKAHDHQLTLLPRLDSFTCNACGLKGDRSPYICVQCDFMIHQDCLGLPRVININRHDHRVSRTSVLGLINSVCRVCRQKVNWTCGGYLCKRCPGYVVHSKCATRKDVWNGIELEGVPEETEDIEPYVVIDDYTIQHFSHKEHYLRHNDDGILYEENNRCSACSHPIGLQSFYGCLSCDFILHQNCAKLPRKKWHVLHNERLTLVTNEANYFQCGACYRMSNGFRYKDKNKMLDVRCGSISEPFAHPSHPNHPLYAIPGRLPIRCINCNIDWGSSMLSCIEDGCKFVLCFCCATLPQVIKHRFHDYPLTLCYGDDDDESGEHYWCDICEKECDPRKWFYTCEDHYASLHTECVLGTFGGFMPRSLVKIWFYQYEVVLNDSVSRPFCTVCKSRCLYPIILKTANEPTSKRSSSGRDAFSMSDFRDMRIVLIRGITLLLFGLMLCIWTSGLISGCKEREANTAMVVVIPVTMKMIIERLMPIFGRELLWLSLNR
ncbi:unnamed protein product [Microthlaspi erraticum]|uniref:Phorbol-ester/DAG-type domain-containing protein n=1 Tax=Microthlaspi erraticum TaxID=1685480 RepID=A0A6D2KKC5_9BRAS|nr:unnamed protein product [Microthlaspi erraticum]